MRLGTVSRTLMALAASATLATYAFGQEHVNISPGAVRDELNQSSAASQTAPSQPQSGASQAEVKTPKKPAAPAPKAPMKPADKNTAAPAAATSAKTEATAPAKPTPGAQGKTPAATDANAKATAAAPAKPLAATDVKSKATTPALAKPSAATDAKAKTTSAAPAKTPASADKGAKKPTEAAKEPAKAASATPTASAEKAPEEKPVVRRDPFDTLLTKARAGNAAPENLPPGKAGLIVATLRIDGIVHGPNGMIAIVSNPQQRVYFLRDGDKLYDGAVDKIALDSISFHEIGKDAFGKPLERTVTKPLYASSGEQR